MLVLKENLFWLQNKSTVKAQTPKCTNTFFADSNLNFDPVSRMCNVVNRFIKDVLKLLLRAVPLFVPTLHYSADIGQFTPQRTERVVIKGHILGEKGYVKWQLLVQCSLISPLFKQLFHQNMKLCFVVILLQKPLFSSYVSLCLSCSFSPCAKMFVLMMAIKVQE